MARTIEEFTKNPELRKKTLNKIEKRIGEIQSDPSIMDRTESFGLDLKLSGSQLMRLKIIQVFLCEILEYSEQEAFEYLINEAISLEIYKLGLVRQAVLSNLGITIQEEDNLVNV